MLLQLDNGIFYEFIESAIFFDKDPKRLTIGEVKVGVNYVMIISTNAGLWAYNSRGHCGIYIGETIPFDCFRKN